MNIAPDDGEARVGAEALADDDTTNEDAQCSDTSQLHADSTIPLRRRLPLRLKDGSVTDQKTAQRETHLVSKV
jgi:hypothetical protein